MATPEISRIERETAISTALGSVDTLGSIWDKEGRRSGRPQTHMKVRDVQSMDLADIRSEIELIEAEARRMAPSEAEFRRRFPTMAGRLQTLIEQRSRLEGGEAPPKPAPERPGPRIVGPTRRPASFLDLREELLEEDDEAPPARPAAAPEARPDAELTKQVAARDAEIRRLREERDDWRGKAEGAESRLMRGAEMARRLEEALAELALLRERVAELELAPGAPDDANHEATAALAAEVEQLRNEQETMQASHHEEIERLRDRHRQEIESYLAHQSERERLAERVAALEAELDQLRSAGDDARAASDQAQEEAERIRAEADGVRAELTEARADSGRLRAELEAATERAHAEAAAASAAHEETVAELRRELASSLRQRSEDVSRVENDLEAVRAANVVATAERERIASQLEAATLDRSVVTIGILQVVQGLAARIQDEPRFQALSDADAVGEETRRALFQALERFSSDTRAIGTDMGPEAFLHALSERLDAIPGWIGTVIEALIRSTQGARTELAARDEALESARADAAASTTRVSSLEAEIAGLRSAAETERAGSRAEIERAAVERQALEARVSEAESRAERDAGEVQRLEEALEGSERHVAELENELASARQAQDGLKARIDELSISLESERLRAADLERQAEQHAGELAEARARHAALQGTIERALDVLTAPAT